MKAVLYIAQKSILWYSHGEMGFLQQSYLEKGREMEQNILKSYYDWWVKGFYKSYFREKSSKSCKFSAEYDFSTPLKR